MKDSKGIDRRSILGSLGVTLSTALTSWGAGLGKKPASRDSAHGDAYETGRTSEVAADIAGDDAIAFRKHTLDLGACEAVCVSDVNRDGRLDIVSGGNWYEQLPPAPGRGPRFIKHKFREIPFSAPYVEDLSDLAIDITGDGYPDIVTCSHWTKPLSWWENPGASGKPWVEHVMLTEGSPIEFTFLVDILNTGKPTQLLPQFGYPRTPMVWYELAPGAAEPWIKHQISPTSYPHGIGAGDLTGDGRTDIITPRGWFEAPADPRNGEWVLHPEFDLGATGFIYVEDVNHDGVPDMVTSLGHDYGIFWMEQKLGAGGKRTWTKHMIDEVWSQAHAMTLADLNGDGRNELVAGKRFWSHDTDPGANQPLGLYWYEQLDTARGIQWKRHIIDYSTRTGGGIQIPVVDIDGDGDLDIIVAGRSGLFLFENLTKSL
jgi:hypothetical protein